MNFGQNLYNWFLSNAQSLVLLAIVVIGLYLGFKREFSKLIGFLVVSLVAVGLVFNADGAVRWLAAGVLVLWCGVFLRAENTEKSMVRALLLTPPTVVAQSWTVGLLYQFPEAAADASDAAAQVQLCTGQGNTLQTALTEAERGLPRKASYRLCEYLLLNAETTLKTIRQAETVLKEEPVQGLSARVLCMDLFGEELAAADGENELFPEQLLQHN